MGRSASTVLISLPRFSNSRWFYHKSFQHHYLRLYGEAGDPEAIARYEAHLAKRREEAYSSLLVAFTSFQLFTYPLERLQFQRISIQLVLRIYVGFINIFDSGFFCHAYNKIFLCYVHSQTENYTAWDPFHHHRRLHNAASCQNCSRSLWSIDNPPLKY